MQDVQGERQDDARALGRGDERAGTEQAVDGVLRENPEVGAYNQTI